MSIQQEQLRAWWQSSLTLRVIWPYLYSTSFPKKQGFGLAIMETTALNTINIKAKLSSIYIFLSKTVAMLFILPDFTTFVYSPRKSVCKNQHRPVSPQPPLTQACFVSSDRLLHLLYNGQSRWKCIMREVFSIKEPKELFWRPTQDSRCTQLLVMLMCDCKVQTWSPLLENW